MRIDRRLDAARAAIEQAHAEHVLEIRDRRRNSRLRHGKLACRLADAARFHHSREDIEVAHSKPAPEAAFPFHCDGSHKAPLMRSEEKSKYTYANFSDSTSIWN